MLPRKGEEGIRQHKGSTKVISNLCLQLVVVFNTWKWQMNTWKWQMKISRLSAIFHVFKTERKIWSQKKIPFHIQICIELFLAGNKHVPIAHHLPFLRVKYHLPFPRVKYHSFLPFPRVKYHFMYIMTTSSASKNSFR